MGVSVSHAFVCPIPDDLTDDPNRVSPDHWNAAHSVSVSFTPEQAQDAGLLGLPEVRTATGTITVDADDDDHILCGAGACTVNLPASADRTLGRPFKIVDYAGDASSNNKTIVPNGVETIVGMSTFVLNFDNSSTYVFPREDGTGWYI